MEATPGKPRHRADSEVICTAYYSKIQPLENGEVIRHFLAITLHEIKIYEFVYRHFIIGYNKHFI